MAAYQNFPISVFNLGKLYMFGAEDTETGDRIHKDLHKAQQYFNQCLSIPEFKQDANKMLDQIDKDLKRSRCIIQ
jgi:hypothetical protein